MFNLQNIAICFVIFTVINCIATVYEFGVKCFKRKIIKEIKHAGTTHSKREPI